MVHKIQICQIVKWINVKWKLHFWHTQKLLFAFRMRDLESSILTKTKKNIQYAQLQSLLHCFIEFIELIMLSMKWDMIHLARSKTLFSLSHSHLQTQYNMHKTNDSSWFFV